MTGKFCQNTIGYIGGYKKVHWTQWGTRRYKMMQEMIQEDTWGYDTRKYKKLQDERDDARYKNIRRYRMI